MSPGPSQGPAHTSTAGQTQTASQSRGNTHPPIHPTHPDRKSGTALEPHTNSAISQDGLPQIPSQSMGGGGTHPSPHLPTTPV